MLWCTVCAKVGTFMPYLYCIYIKVLFPAGYGIYDIYIRIKKFETVAEDKVDITRHVERH